MNQITITKPDDFHIHLREGSMLNLTVKHAAMQFGKILVMPNLSTPIIDINKLNNYYTNIKSINHNIDLLMTLYLTDNTSVELIKQASKYNYIIGCKLYPAGATTNSDFGLTDITKIYNTLDAMEKYNLALLIHGEVTDNDIDIFDREKIFIDKILIPIREKFPGLRITLEHISTKQGAMFTENYYTKDNNKTAATITPHHLLLNTNDLLAGGLKPHNYCLPIIKNQTHQKYIQQAALSGKPCFFAGSDSAPHTIKNKISACGCAGIYHGPNTILYYTEFFDRNNQLDKLEKFTSIYGSNFYNLAINNSKLLLNKTEFVIPQEYHHEDNAIIPLWAGGKLSWEIKP